jgi:hypothetical protein
VATDSNRRPAGVDFGKSKRVPKSGLITGDYRLTKVALEF